MFALCWPSMHQFIPYQSHDGNSWNKALQCKFSFTESTIQVVLQPLLSICSQGVFLCADLPISISDHTLQELKAKTSNHVCLVIYLQSSEALRDHEITRRDYASSSLLWSFFPHDLNKAKVFSMLYWRFHSGIPPILEYIHIHTLHKQCFLLNEKTENEMYTACLICSNLFVHTSC